MKSKAEYLSKFTPATYEYWTAEQDYEAALFSNKEARKYYDSQQKKLTIEQEGPQEKAKVVQTLIQEFEAVEKTLQAAGGKTFSEMHPEIAPPVNHGHRPYVTPTPKPWEPKFSFTVPDLDTVKLLHILSGLGYLTIL